MKPSEPATAAPARSIGADAYATRKRQAHSRLDPHHHHPPVTVLWGVAAGGFLVFAIVAFAVTHDWTADFDMAVLVSLRDANDLSNAWGPAWFEETAAELSALGGYPILVTVSIGVLSVLLLLRKGAAAIFLAGGLVGGMALSSALKPVFSRTRPDLVDHLDRTFTSSFPSAHAMLSMLAYLTLAAVAIRFVPRHSVRVFILSAAFGLAVVIGVSRVYLGVHWPSDVLAGWSLGIGWASLCWLAAHYWSRQGVRQDDALGHSRT